MTSWSSVPRIQYATQPIQALGDAPFRAADTVISAVDNQPARDYVGWKTAQFGVPLVEGGFSGPRVNSTILLNDVTQAPCWHCNIYRQEDRNRSIQLGCTKVARQAEEAGFIPAVQSAAAYLGAFISEVAIQLLHGHTQLGNTQVFMNMRTASATVARLQFNPKCRRHPSPREIAFRLDMPPGTTCGHLLAELTRLLDEPVVSLPFGYVVRVGCAQCKQPISVHQPAWVMADLLFCQDCGGPWSRTDKPGNEIYPTLSTDVEPLLDLPIEHVGLVPGSVLEVESAGKEVLCELTSDVDLPFFTPVVENSDVAKIR